MVRKISVAVVLAVLATAGVARAQNAGGQLKLGDAYCDYLMGSAAVEADRLMLPELFATAGYFNVGDNVLGEIQATHRSRIQAGLSYDIMNLWQGIAMLKQARAECDRHRSEQALLSALDSGGVGAVAALQARSDELAKMMPEAEQILASLHDDLREARATVEELNVAQVRYDELKKLAMQTQIDYAAASSHPQLASRQTLPALLASYGAADDRVEDWAGSVRASKAFSLKLHGGYDDIVGIPEKQPIFGFVTASVSLGAIFTHWGNSTAREGRQLALQNDAGPTGRRMAELAATMKATYQAEKARLHDVELLLGDLEGQYTHVKALQTSLVRRYQDYLWFEIAQMRAERAYLSSHTQELQHFLEGK